MTETFSGYQRPIRHVYIHGQCGAPSELSDSDARTLAVSPKFYVALPCDGCKEMGVVDDFTWEDGSVVGS